MRLCWLTDIHLNFIGEAEQLAFAQTVRATAADVVMISGDIAEAPTVLETLSMLARETGVELHYVLGNHDFYRGSIAQTRRDCRHSDVAQYLHGRPPVALAGGVGVVGVDGWGDGRFGRPRDSDVLFTDWYLIEEFGEVGAIRDVDARLRIAGAQGDDSATHLRESLSEAAESFEHVLIVTHVPPFEAAAGHNGSQMAELWTPWLACQSTGEVILDAADRNPHVTFEVLCGHTHTERVTHPRPNVITRTGAATYREPAVQRVWQI